MSSHNRSLLRSIPHDAGERFLLGMALLALVLGCTLLCSLGGLERYRHEARIGYLLSDSTVKRREAKALLWQRLESEAPVYLRDTLRAGSDGPVTVQFENGRQLMIPAGTTVKLEQLHTMAVEVSVLKGQLAASDSVVVRELPKAGLKMPSRETLMAMPRLPVPHVNVPR